MVSKTSMLPLVKAFDWKAVDAGLREKPQLVKHRDERGRNWLHVCCATVLDGRDPKSSIRTADVLLGCRDLTAEERPIRAVDTIRLTLDDAWGRNP